LLKRSKLQNCAEGLHERNYNYYADPPRRKVLLSNGIGNRRGIIQRSALWVLCRYRHKTHWTKHPSRLDRQFGRKHVGDEGYAEEELVAELGAAFLCADLELALEPREDHAAYIAHWLNVLHNDKRAIFRAAAHAQRAADHLHKQQPSLTEAA
jgi:antirestriction protein ArdC